MSTASASPVSPSRTPTGSWAVCQVSRGMRVSAGSARGYGTDEVPLKAQPRMKGSGSTVLQLHRVRELHAHTAVDHQRLTADVGRQVRREEQQAGGDVGRDGDAAQRRVLLVAMLQLLGHELA